MMMTTQGDLHQEQESVRLGQVPSLTSGRKTPKKVPRLSIKSQILSSIVLQDEKTRHTEVLMVVPGSKLHILLRERRNILRLWKKQNLDINLV